MLGCTETHEADVAVPIEKMPAPLMKVATDKLPDVKFDTVYKGTKAGKEVYEIRGKNKEGKIREVEVTADGEIVEVE
jgi:hypothetical protein